MILNILHLVNRNKPEVELAIKNHSVKSIDDRVTIISVCSGKCDNALKESIADGQNVIWVDKCKTPWINFYKIEAIANALKKVTTPYALLLDCRDVVICNPLKDIVDTFEGQNCDILFSVGTCKQIHINPHHLNGGTVIGKTDSLLSLYSNVPQIEEEYWDKYKESIFWHSEQLRIAYYIEHSDISKKYNIKYDNRDEIFKVWRNGEYIKHLDMIEN